MPKISQKRNSPTLAVRYDEAKPYQGVNIMLRYTDEELLTALRECGRYVSTRKWREEGRRPSARIIETRFGNWKDAWKRAGIVVPEKVMQPRWTRENVLTKLKEKGEYVQVRKWTGPPEKTTIINLFGTWEAAWQAAGINIPTRSDHRSRKSAPTRHTETTSTGKPAP